MSEGTVDAEPVIGSDFVFTNPELAAAFKVCIVFDESVIGWELCGCFEQLAICRDFEIDQRALREVEEWGVPDGGETAVCGVEEMG